MGENYHATFQINPQISSKFVRTSRAVFNDAFKKRHVLALKRHYLLSLQGLLICGHTRLLPQAQKPMLLAVDCVIHTRCRESSTNFQNMWPIISVLFLRYKHLGTLRPNINL